jgi:uncharacterized protein
MKKLYFLFLLQAIVVTTNLNAQTIDATGSWLGSIRTGAIELRIVFNISLASADSLIATLDSPDQGAKNIKLGKVTLEGSKIEIAAPGIAGMYNGEMKNDSTMDGTWKQAGQSFPLNMKKLKVPFSIKRPQEPKQPFNYNSENVTFINEKFNIKLAGTLTMPKGDGPFKAVILITGSGAQNRNEELMGHKPFLVIADYLTRNGIAVLRYDDRGMGESQGNYIVATSADLATDAEAALNFMKKNPKIIPDKIGLIGHSEGGLIAAILAAGNPGIGFIVSLAGPGVVGKDLIVKQTTDINKLSGAKESDIKEANQTYRKLYSIIIKEKDNKQAEAKVTEFSRKTLEKKNVPEEDIKKALIQVKMTYGANAIGWWRYFLATDPAEFWKKVQCPVLALNGDKDVQVSAVENTGAIRKALQKQNNKASQTVILQGLNHLFQHCKTGLPSEYGSIEETFSPEALKIAGDWILNLK